MSTESLSRWIDRHEDAVALVFIDVVDSTSLLYARGTAFYSRTLRAFRARVEDLIERSDGRLVAPTGDGVFAVFATVTSAFGFGRELFEDSGHPRLAVRCGIHRGRVRVDADTLVGRNVHLAARVMQHGVGHELWLSEEAKVALEAESPATAAAIQWLTHEECLPKGLPATQRLWRAG